MSDDVQGCTKFAGSTTAGKQEVRTHGWVMKREQDMEALPRDVGE